MLAFEIGGVELSLLNLSVQEEHTVIPFGKFLSNHMCVAHD